MRPHPPNITSRTEAAVLQQRMKCRWRRETSCLLRLHPPRSSDQSVTLRCLLFCPAICLPPRSFCLRTSPSPSAEPVQALHPKGLEGFYQSRPGVGMAGGDQQASCPRGLQRGLTHGPSVYFGCLSLPISDSARPPLSVHNIHEDYLS